MLYAFKVTTANHAVLTLVNAPTGMTWDIPLVYYPNTATALEDAVERVLTVHGWYCYASADEIDWEFRRQERHAEHVRNMVNRYGE